MLPLIFEQSYTGKEIQLRQKLRALSSGTLSQSLELENFVTPVDRRKSQRVIDLVQQR